MIVIIGLLILCIAAAFFDIRKRTIPNAIVIVIYAWGMCRVLLYGGMTEFISRLICCFLALILFIPFYLSDSLGAGDVKLYSVIPLYINREKILLFYLLVFCVAAVPTLGRLILLPSKRKQIKKFCNFLKLVYLSRGQIHIEVPPYSPNRVPMAVPMAIGILIGIVIDNFGHVNFY